MLPYLMRRAFTRIDAGTCLRLDTGRAVCLCPCEHQHHVHRMETHPTQGDNWTPYYRQIHRRARLHAAQLPPDQLNPRGHYDARLRPVFSRFTRPRKGRDERSGYLPLSLPPPGASRCAFAFYIRALSKVLVSFIPEASGGRCLAAMVMHDMRFPTRYGICFVSS